MATENLTTFTIAGAQAAKMGATATRLTWTDVIRSDECYCYKDYTVDHFDLAVGIIHDFTMNLVDWDASPSGYISTLMQVYALANAVNDLEALKTGNENFITVNFEPKLDGGVTKASVVLTEWASNGRANNDYGTLGTFSKNDVIYVRVIISGSSAKAGFYTVSGDRDSGDATDGDVDNLSITLDSATLKFRYLYVAMSRDAFTLESDGYVENLELNEAVVVKPGGSIVPILQGIGIL